MRVTDRENVPLLWDDARDLRFFRITAGLFPADFCQGASALLAANDGDDEPGYDERALAELCPVPVRIQL